MKVRSKRDIRRIQKAIGLSFKDPSLLETALVHRSFAHENGLGALHNERLEFLGDSVLGLVSTEYLFELFPDLPEGDLSRIRSIIVSEKSLTLFAKKMDFGSYLLLGRGEQASGGRKKASILADAFEALIGAFYLDRGYGKVKKFLLPYVEQAVLEVSARTHRKDYKSLLQEFTQKRLRLRPVYKVMGKKGPEHAPVFQTAVYVGGKELGTGFGKTKIASEEKSAEIAFNRLSAGEKK